MIKISDAEWVVMILGDKGKFFWDARTNEDVGLDSPNGDRMFKNEYTALYHWKEFAELNGITKWETEQ